MCLIEYIYIYIYILREKRVCMYVCVYIYIYIYIYIYRERERGVCIIHTREMYVFSNLFARPGYIMVNFKLILTDSTCDLSFS